jgi:hypothetical protein
MVILGCLAVENLLVYIYSVLKTATVIIPINQLILRILNKMLFLDTIEYR